MSVRSFLFTSSTVALIVAIIAYAVCPIFWEAPGPGRRAGASAVGDPVAVISYLPSEVSNGTWSNLNASGSSDSDGMITNFTWAITLVNKTSNVTWYLFGEREDFKFRTPGLYKIILTVKDNDNKTGTAFTAVYSIIDSDNDGLPDWWEMKFFFSLDDSGSDDHDRDGYTNLQEFASRTDPTAKDPQPGLVQYLKENLLYLAIIVAVIVGALFIILPRMKRKRKQEERTKIEYAIEIEKALQEEK